MYPPDVGHLNERALGALDRAAWVVSYVIAAPDAEGRRRIAYVESVNAALGARTVGVFTDPPGQHRGWQECMAALYAHPGPNRIFTTWSLGDVGVGQLDGRFEFAKDVWDESGGGTFLGRRVVLKTGVPDDLDLALAIHESRREEKRSKQRRKGSS